MVGLGQGGRVSNPSQFAEDGCQQSAFSDQPEPAKERHFERLKAGS
jgi:hypothetical protein